MVTQQIIKKNQQQYIPGQCNIGVYEAQIRLKSGIFGLILLSGFSFLFYVFALPDWLEFLALLISGIIGISGILQYKNKFCIYFGLSAVFNFETFSNITRVESLFNAEKDKTKALRLFCYAFILSFVYALLYVILM